MDIKISELSPKGSSLSATDLFESSVSDGIGGYDTFSQSGLEIADGVAAILGLSVPISLEDGGTSASLVASNGGIFYSTAIATAILSGTATLNQILMSGISSAPHWSTATYPATTTINQLLFSSSNNVISGITTANNGILVTSAGGVPSIGSTLPSAVAISGSTINNSVIGGVTPAAATFTTIGAGGGLFSVTSGGDTGVHNLTISTFNLNSIPYATTNGLLAEISSVSNAILSTNGSGIPSFSTTVPAFTTSSITFNPTTGGIVGTTTNDNAAAGKVGEEVESIVLAGSSISLSNATAANVTTISLTAGDWDVFGNVTVQFSLSSTAVIAWISTTSAVPPDQALRNQLVYTAASIAFVAAAVPSTRLSLSGTTTVYLSALANFSTGTGLAAGKIFARRAR